MNYKKIIIDRINSLGSKQVFIANDFFDLAKYETVRSTLNRLAESGEIKRIMNGVYTKNHLKKTIVITSKILLSKQ